MQGNQGDIINSRLTAETEGEEKRARAYIWGDHTTNQGRGIKMRGSSEGVCRELGSGPVSPWGIFDCLLVLIKSLCPVRSEC